MKVSELLRKKGDKVDTIAPEVTAQAAARAITDKRIGALPVIAPGYKLVGMISERDVARGVAQAGAKAASLTVEALMTREVSVCKPGDSVRDAMRTMSRFHIRHLPVVDDGRLVGIISQRDVLTALLDQAEQEVGVLRDVARVRA